MIKLIGLLLIISIYESNAFPSSTGQVPLKRQVSINNNNIDQSAGFLRSAFINNNNVGRGIFINNNNVLKRQIGGFGFDANQFGSPNGGLPFGSFGQTLSTIVTNNNLVSDGVFGGGSSVISNTSIVGKRDTGKKTEKTSKPKHKPKPGAAKKAKTQTTTATKLKGSKTI